MRYAQIRSMDISNGEGIGVSLFVQGCPFHCRNCFNPETWDFNNGKEWTKEIKENFLNLIQKKKVKRVSLLGGECLADQNLQEVKELGYELGLPKELIDKTPSDGLCGKSDEDKMGISYQVFDNYVRNGVEGDEEMMERIDNRIKANLFKHNPIPYFHTGRHNYVAGKY